MLVKQILRKSYVWMLLLILILISNFILYRTPISPMVLTDETKWVVLGSLLDLAIISPLLVLAINKKKGSFIKRFIILMAGGLILAKFLIPMKYFEPFIWISYIGFGVEGLLILIELSLLIMLVRYMPAIIQKVRSSDETLLFSFPATVREKVGNHPIVKAFSSEFLIFYYAFASWRKSPPKGKGFFTLHSKSSLLAFHIMLIHAIVIETLGLHWWLHDKSIVLSIVLLILNIYSIIFFLGEIQAVRLNPVKLTDNKIYLSLGLAKKMVLSLEDIAAITTDQHVLEQKINSKTTLDFIARDFEEVHPHMILELKNPRQATLFFGVEKTYTRVAIRLDDPGVFIQELKGRLEL